MKPPDWEKMPESSTYGMSADRGSLRGQVGSQVVANALAPYAAQLIGETFDPNKPSAVPSEAMQLLSHALLGALLAEVNGGNAANGAGAAAGGELAAKLITEALYPGKVADLDDNQKANILALSQAVGALAGGIGSDLAGAALGAEVAGNSVENNYLDSRQLLALAEERKDCNGNEACENEAIDRWAKVSKQQGLEMLTACQTPDAACDLHFSQAWQYGKTDVSQLGLNLDQAVSKDLVMRFLETTSGEAYRGSTGSFFWQMAKGVVDSASQLITGGLGYALAFGDVALAPQYHRDPVTGEFKYKPLIDAMPIFGDTSGNPVEAGGYKLGSLVGIDLALLGGGRGKAARVQFLVAKVVLI